MYVMTNISRQIMYRHKHSKLFSRTLVPVVAYTETFTFANKFHSNLFYIQHICFVCLVFI